MKFLDQAKIYLKSGDGGPGAVSFRREKYIEFGGPDGGNGGKGGDVYFRAINNMNTLIDFRYTQHFKAESGLHGMGKNRSGRKGEDLIIDVPVGTQILDEDKETILADMTEEGQEVLFLKGGDGGFGNAHYKSSTNQAPRKMTPGWPGQETAVWLRLKLIADVGLLGMPNAGKSTFLSVVSNAKPKIADYPFTTLHPNLGLVKIGAYDFVIADIPGLIEGAHEGTGLGHRFLGHVERTKVLLHVLDGTEDDIVGNYRIIRGELEKYDTDLIRRPELCVLNKCDALSQEVIEEKIKLFKDETGHDIVPLSCVAKHNVDTVLYKLAGYVLPQDAKIDIEDCNDDPSDTKKRPFDPLR